MEGLRERVERDVKTDRQTEAETETERASVCVCMREREREGGREREESVYVCVRKGVCVNVFV